MPLGRPPGLPLSPLRNGRPGPRRPPEFPFALGVGSKTYTPDCVWFEGGVEPEAVVAIFEIEVGTSPKHRAGGVAFANFVALSGSKRVRFFAITRERNRTLMANTVELFATKL